MMKTEPSFEEKLIRSNLWLIAGCFLVLILSTGFTTVFVTSVPIGSSVAVWEPLPIPEEYFDESGFQEIDFINSTHGWLLGYHVLLQTTDSGESWSASLESGNIGFRGLSIVTPLDIWVSGSGLLRHTIDGGATWETVNAPETGVSDIEFYNCTHGVVADIHRLYRTTNGGISWLNCINWSSEHNSIYDFHLSANTIRVATYDGYYLSEDWGLTWDIVDSRSTYGLSIISENEGWILHRQFVTHQVDDNLFDFPKVAGTNVPYNSYYNDIEFIDSENGWVVGIGPAVIYTPDGGDSWYEQECLSFLFRSVDFINATHGWAAGWADDVARTVTGNSLGSQLQPGFILIPGLLGGGLFMPYISILVGTVSTVVYPFLILILRRKKQMNEEAQHAGLKLDESD
ncbi:MAG: YCF48-related protein [Candidatus Thorarchaeota archaeon]